MPDKTAIMLYVIIIIATFIYTANTILFDIINVKSGQRYRRHINHSYIDINVIDLDVQ